jgi:hypothetical protein
VRVKSQTLIGRARRAARNVAPVAVLLAALALAASGCTSNDKSQAAQPIDPNLYPKDYKAQILAFLRQSLGDRGDFRGVQIGQPTLKPVGTNPHYVVCLQFSARSQIKTKVAIFLEGQITQFIDATPDQCSDAAYQPFTELGAAAPHI